MYDHLNLSFLAQLATKSAPDYGNFTSFIDALVGFVDEFTRAKTATQRLTEVIDTPPENYEGEKKAESTIPDNCEIICSELNFHHPGRVDLIPLTLGKFAWTSTIKMTFL